MNILNLINNSIVNEGDPPVNLAITQGKTYRFSFTYPEDLTLGEIRGQIRTRYADAGGTLLANFNFNVDYVVDPDPTLSKSTVGVILDADITALIPSTKYIKYENEQPLLNFRRNHTYDIEYEQGGTVIELLRGFVQVIPETTVEEV